MWQYLICYPSSLSVFLAVLQHSCAELLLVEPSSLDTEGIAAETGT